MNESLKKEVKELAKEAVLYPQEAPLKKNNNQSRLFIGIPKETTLLENRVPITPNGVKTIVAAGHEVIVETGAGL